MVPRSAVLALLLAGCGEPSRGAPPVPLRERVPAVDPARTVSTRLAVTGMHCSGCEYNVSSALRLVPGVLDAEADHAAGEARVRHDPARAPAEALVTALRAAGYEARPREP